MVLLLRSLACFGISDGQALLDVGKLALFVLRANEAADEVGKFLSAFA